MADIIDAIENEYIRKEQFDFRIGDLVDVHYRIKEGEKERIQIFTGTVIGKNHGGVRATFTVRRIVAGEGVERVFPLNSPWIEEVQIKRHGKVRRGKLYYLRDRVGKATRVKERRVYVTKKTKKAEPNSTPAPEVAAES